ncbi:MAG: radical SAM protein [Planctomycetes bacterium]|nr:radical SAM protein [Planctomycetota bacterium]
MNARSRLLRRLKPLLADGSHLKDFLKRQDERLVRWKHHAAERFPSLIRPAPRQLTIAITAACNLRCQGCRYGRDFMLGDRLELDMVRQCLDDAAAAGVATARFYGGEPLLHPDLPAMIRHARGLGMEAYVTTNGVLLERRIDELYEAGLRWLSMGFYGLGDDYDGYTQRDGVFERLRRSLTTVRERYADRVAIQLNYMLSQRSCSVANVRAVWEFARGFDLHMGVDPISSTIPFFTEPGETLGIPESMRPELEAVSAEFLRLKRAFPQRVVPSEQLLRSLPALLLDDLAGEVPCDAYELLWVGANGAVQLCDVHFELGNLHERRLRDLLFTKAHRCAARDGFQLKCPTCMCKIDSRIRRHGPTRAAAGAKCDGR